MPPALTVERRVAERRESIPFASAPPAANQPGLSAWLRSASGVQAGLSALTLLAVLLLGRVHASQLAEMRRATASSGNAAYAACLGSQAARGLLAEIKAERLAARLTPATLDTHAGAQLTEAKATAAPRLSFAAEPSTSVADHVPVLFHFTVQNTGEAAALEAKIWSSVAVIDAGKTPGFDYSQASAVRRSITPRSQPVKVITYTEKGGVVAPLQDADFQRVMAGSAYLVAYGKAVYKDAHGGRHWAEFCRVLLEHGGAAGAGTCSAYNGSGEDTHTLAEVNQHSTAPAPETHAALEAAPEPPETLVCEVPKETASLRKN